MYVPTYTCTYVPISRLQSRKTEPVDFNQGTDTYVCTHLRQGLIARPFPRPAKQTPASRRHAPDARVRTRRDRRRVPSRWVTRALPADLFRGWLADLFHGLPADLFRGLPVDLFRDESAQETDRRVVQLQGPTVIGRIAACPTDRNNVADASVDCRPR